MGLERDADHVAPLLILGLGNRLLRDDGLGLDLLERLEPTFADDPRVELLDGGTQGLALLPRLAGRSALLLLDAVALDAAPGRVHHLHGTGAVRVRRAGGAHEGNAGELLAAARLLGDLPASIEVVGMEPAEIRTGIGLSEPVRANVDAAAELAHAVAGRMLAVVASGSASCTS